jgi:long-chain acyl-CoA synthetase
MRDHLATLLDDFRRYHRDIAVVRYQGVRRRETTYGELARLAGRFASLLEHRGVVAGDRVLLWGENSAEWIAAFYGCMMRGVLAVPLDSSGAAEFAARVTADVRPKLAVGDALLLDRLASSSPSARSHHTGNNGGTTEHVDVLHVPFESWDSELPAEETGPISRLSQDTALEILFTSGTTGDPKGVVITHGNVLASVGPVEEASQPYMRYEWLVHPLRILHTLPLSHVFGQTMGLWIPPIYKAELHFESRLAAPRLIDLIRRERISVLAAVPRVLALLKSHLEMNLSGLEDRIAAAGPLNPWLRWWRYRKVHRQFGLKFWAFVSGGGALPGPLEQFWNALGFVLVQGYGMTETTALITLNHPFHVAKGTIGKPLAGREVKLAPDGEVLVRGDMISEATWAGGQMRPRQDEWLATGDLAERQPSGELKFIGRKSEVIVTAAGLNLHPEDLEAAVEEQPGVAACAVVPLETQAGTEACAVLAVRGAEAKAAEAIEAANAKLPEFQRILRWVLWPEPDLPRTSTGKVKRKMVAQWLHRTESVGKAGAANGNGKGAVAAQFGASSDWLLGLIAQITGESPSGVGDELRLSEDLHLDSLGRVQLAAAIEERLGVVSENGLLEEAPTLGDLRQFVAGEGRRSAEQSMPEVEQLVPVAAGSRGNVSASGAGPPAAVPSPWPAAHSAPSGAAPVATAKSADQGGARPPTVAEPSRTRFDYPTWPWWKPFLWARIAFTEMVARPLVWFLAAPKVVALEPLDPGEPILIVANHVTAYDAPLVQYALPGPMRRRVATAMLGELLEDFRHARNPYQPPGQKGLFPFGPPAYLLVTALFNVFPLPQRRDFQSSFAHAGRALDRGYHVLVFPEGARSAEGKLAPFRQGIGLLAKQSYTAVLPVGLRGLGELKATRRRWFRSGKIEVHVGRPIRFSTEMSEAAITERLHDEVEQLLGTGQGTTKSSRE